MNAAQFAEAVGAHLAAQGLPERLIARLYDKVAGCIFDAGSTFQLALIEADDEDEEKEEGGAEEASGVYRRMQLVAARDVKPEEDVWLVDHAWTFRIREAKQRLREDAALRARIAQIIGYTGPGADGDGAAAPGEEEGGESGATERAVAAIYDRLPRFVESYRLTAGDKMDAESCWYIKDEVGSAVCCSTAGPAGDDGDAPNLGWCVLPPVLPDKPYSLTVMWPIAALEEGDFCRADPLIVPRRGLTDKADRVKRILFYDEESERAQAVAECLEAFEHLDAEVRKVTPRPYTPSATASPAPVLSPVTPQQPITFYTDSALVSHAVTDPHFFIVPAPEDAQVMWLSHYTMARTDEFPHAAFVSQVPEERFFTNKWLLARTIRQNLGYVPWWCETYDGVTELNEFIGAFAARQARIDTRVAAGSSTASAATGTPTEGEETDNLWIVKPHNLARSMDMFVSDNLPWLLSMAATGPKIYSKYISHPATLRGRKFDLRFIVLLRSLPAADGSRNLELFLYDVFWTRFATEQYSLDSFECYDKHWTVMNYTDPSKILELKYSDFVAEFDAQFAAAFAGRLGPSGSVWADHVAPKIRDMLVQVFAHQNLDDVSHDRFRGMYGIDLMVRKSSDDGGALQLDPVLLEITYSPDCKRAVRDYPHFFNDVFNCLFRGVAANMVSL